MKDRICPECYSHAIVENEPYHRCCNCGTLIDYCEDKEANEELAPCYWCKTMPEPIEPINDTYIIECSNCGILMFDPDKERLRKTWNSVGE